MAYLSAPTLAVTQGVNTLATGIHTSGGSGPAPDPTYFVKRDGTFVPVTKAQP